MGGSQHINRPLHSSDGFFLAKESRDVEHAWSLALADERQTPGIHDVAELILFLLYPLVDNLFLILQ